VADPSVSLLLRREQAVDTYRRRSVNVGDEGRDISGGGKAGQIEGRRRIQIALGRDARGRQLLFVDLGFHESIDGFGLQPL